MPITNWFSKKNLNKAVEIIEPLTPVQQALLDEITAERLSHYTWKTRLREYLTFRLSLFDLIKSSLLTDIFSCFVAVKEKISRIGGPTTFSCKFQQ